MEADEYREKGKELVDYVANYLEGITNRKVFPDVKPGYLRKCIDNNPPLKGESWDQIMKDVNEAIVPGLTHWQSPHMHAYFPAQNSYPSLLGDMLSNGFNCIGFTWASSPACTELEIMVMDWLVEMMGLPKKFLHTKSQDGGGGVIQTTASEATLVCFLAARTEAIKRYQKQYPEMDDAEINCRLVAYCSDQAHSSVEKTGNITLIKIRSIETDDTNFNMKPEKLSEAIRNDRKDGYIPFFVCATLGSTGVCSFDDLSQLGPICEKERLWLHVDAAYAGSAFVCSEYRTFLKGIEFASSYAFNPSKWFLVNFDCTAMWINNKQALYKTFHVNPLYLQHENSGQCLDFMNWQIPLSRRFRSLKLWSVIRSYGIIGLQKMIRNTVNLAATFESFLHTDLRFFVPAKRHLGLVVFTLLNDNEKTEKLLNKINKSGKMYVVPASIKGKYVIRFTITSWKTTIEHIAQDWKDIKQFANEVLEESSHGLVKEK